MTEADENSLPTRLVSRLAHLLARPRAWVRNRPWARMGLQFILVILGCLVFLQTCALLLRPDTASEPPPVDEQELAEVEQHRQVRIQPDGGPRLQVEVDYSEGPDGAWFPRNESPVLAELVEAGDLPPVDERVGPEPVVYQGHEGIGNYGGTWITPGADPFGLANRLSAPTLVRWSPHGYPIVPHIAREYEVSDDYREYTFHLRRGMRWSDGHPFTADDILYWWEHEANSAAVMAFVPPLMRPTGEPGRVEKVDDHTVRFIFDEPHGLFLPLLATAHGLPICGSPAHYLRPYHPEIGDQDLIERTLRARRLDSARALYENLKEVTNPEHPRLWPWLYRDYSTTPPHTAVRNPYYWMVDPEGNQLPYIDQIMFVHVTRDMLPSSIASGRFSMASSRVSEHALLMGERHRGGYRIYRWFRADRSDAMIHINLNRAVEPGRPETQWKRKLLNEPRFRRALSVAIDREAIIRAIYAGETEPAQVAPGPYSFFHHQHAFEHNTGYEPDLANRLLDEIGLTQRDREGYRTFPDGTRMVFFLNHATWLNPATAQFIVEDWAAVGVRAIPRMRDSRLFYTEKAALLHDFTMFTGENEFVPILEPRVFLPVSNESNFALGFARWYSRGGLYDPSVAEEGGEGVIPVPEDHPLHEALLLYEQLKRTGDRDEQKALFDRILDIAADNVWTIGICTSPEYVITVDHNLRNVPEQAAFTFTFLSPGNTGQEVYFFRDGEHPRGVAGSIQRQILQPNLPPRALGAAEQAGSTGWLGTLVRYLFIGIGIGIVALLAVRHPFVARRLLIMVPTLLFISVVVFTIIELPPGDFLTSRIMELQQEGQTLDADEIARLREMYHLDDHVVLRYLRWSGLYWFTTFRSGDMGLIQGHLGRTMATNQEVRDVVGDRILLTFLISLGTIVFTWAVAIPLGIFSAVRQYSITDYVLTFIGFIGMCVPPFLLALLMMYLSKTLLDLDVDRLFSPEYALQPYWDLAKLADLMKHIWVPVVILGVGGTAGMIRVMRANLLDELKKPYVTTARAKGVRPMMLLLKYPVRMALNPFISGIGAIFPVLISGGALVAMVLSLPTIGPLMLDALLMADTMLAGSMLMVLSLLGIIGVLISDLLLLWLDPRIRFEGGGR